MARLYEGGPAPWELTPDGEVVASGRTPMGAGDRWDDYEFTIDEDLEPGTYELDVYDPGGLGDPDLAARDTKTFTIS